MAKPMHSGTTRARFSYADDIGILGIGPTMIDSAAAAQQEADSLLDWAHRNAVMFDHEKSEVVQFQGRSQKGFANINIDAAESAPTEHIRWLGVYLYPQISFKYHVEKWCGKAIKVAQHLRRLNIVKRGAAPGPLVTAVNAWVLPIATYAGDVWWPGMTRPSRKGISTPQTTHFCNLIDKTLNLAMRAALSVCKTTPNLVIHRESGIPPARVLLEGIRLRVAARLNTLDNRHPLRIRASTCPNVGTQKYKKKIRLSSQPETQMTRVQRAYRQLPSAEAAEALAAPKYSE